TSARRSRFASGTSSVTSRLQRCRASSPAWPAGGTSQPGGACTGDSPIGTRIGRNPWRNIMASHASRESDDPLPTALDDVLRAIPDPARPDGLLGSCLATVLGPGVRRPDRPRRRPLTTVTWAATALVLVAVAGYLARSRHADAAELLQAVKAAWTTVPALHQVVRTTGPGGTRTEETWVVRHGGLRQETRAGGDLVGVVVRAARWEFRWDGPGRTVAVWAAELASAHRRPGDEGLVFDRNDFETWARSHRAEIVAEGDTIAGRKVQKVALKWPGGAGKTQTTTVWFDSRSLLP